jgi:hypothetical protein
MRRSYLLGHKVDLKEELERLRKAPNSRLRSGMTRGKKMLLFGGIVTFISLTSFLVHSPVVSLS